MKLILVGVELGWNDFAWGIAGNLIATGDAITATLGTVVFQLMYLLVHPQITINLLQQILVQYAIDIQTKVFPTGIALTSALGTADAGPDAMATGIAMSMGLGTIDAFNQTGWGRQGWNVNAWGVEGQFANVDVTGIAMTAAAGTLGATGDSNFNS